jgi:nucleoid-associated protein YgaU
MRLVLLAAVGFALAACDDDGAGTLVRSDVAPGEADGCVVIEAGAASRPRSWTVREGDSLRRIAQRVYGNESLWKAIRDANPGKVAAGDVIAPGTELTIPYDGI